MRRGMTPPKISSGGARYEIVERPRRRSIVQWKGDDPWRMSVPVIFDGWISEHNVEYDIRRVSQMAQSRGDLSPPFTFRLDGALPVSGGLWIMESIEWGDNVYWHADKRGGGNRIRQDATLNCLQYETEVILQISKPPPMSVPYRVTSGETLAMIAAKKGVTVDSIRVANNLRDGKKIKAGQRLMIPPPIGKNAAK